jgi:hypothetical protein
MDGERFDRLTKAMARSSTSRRSLIRRAFGAALGVTAIGAQSSPLVEAASPFTATKRKFLGCADQEIRRIAKTKQMSPDWSHRADHVLQNMEELLDNTHERCVARGGGSRAVSACEAAAYPELVTVWSDSAILDWGPWFVTGPLTNCAHLLTGTNHNNLETPEGCETTVPSVLCGDACVACGEHQHLNPGNCSCDCDQNAFYCASTFQCVQCGAGQTLDSACTCACARGAAACGADCADLHSDPNHCGACGHACSDAEGEMCCNGKCVAALTDVNNCGACGHRCRRGEHCDQGKGCCPKGKSVCNGGCVADSSFLVDPENCGACGHRCASGVCDDGQCRPIACPDGQTPCGDVCVTLASDVNNCGRCGNACTLGPCDSGVCPGALTIHRVDENGNPLPAAQWFLYEDAGGARGAFVASVTDADDHAADGDIHFASVTPGAYVALEGGTPGGYASAPPQSVTVDENQTTEITVGVLASTLTIHVVDQFGQPHPFNDFGFFRVSRPDSPFVHGGGGSISDSDNDGTGQLKGLHPGDYLVEFIMSGNGFIFLRQSFNVSTGQNVELTTPICPQTGNTFCANGCLKLDDDPNNCGACGNVCVSGHCSQGACAETSVTTASSCDGDCPDLSSDPLNCGAAGNACPPGAVCLDGACAAATPVAEP